METSYLKLVTGSRLTNYMGLQMVPGFESRFGKNYMYLEIPVLGARGSEEESTKKVLRNQHVFVEAACSVEIRGLHMLEVEPNPALAEFGQIQPGFRLHPGGARQAVGFWFTARKDTDLDQLGYAVRLYMPA